jgi:hypothetical protein
VKEPLTTTPAGSIGGHIQAVDCPVGMCTWKSVGALEDSTGCLCLELHVIPRLKWVLVWVRGDLMLWDYDKEEVVHWITMEQVP